MYSTTLDLDRLRDYDTYRIFFKAIGENRRGFFVVHANEFSKNVVDTLRLYMLGYKIEDNKDDTVTCRAYSDLFDKVLEGEEEPEYRFVRNDDQIKFVRIRHELSINSDYR